MRWNSSVAAWCIIGEWMNGRANFIPKCTIGKFFKIFSNKSKNPRAQCYVFFVAGPRLREFFYFKSATRVTHKTKSHFSFHFPFQRWQRRRRQRRDIEYHHRIHTFPCLSDYFPSLAVTVTLFFIYFRLVIEQHNNDQHCSFAAIEKSTDFYVNSTFKF